MNINGSFRKKENPFSQVSNAILRNNSISLEAKGIYCIIQSFVQSGLPCGKSDIMALCPEKDGDFEKAWNEITSMYNSTLSAYYESESE